MTRALSVRTPNACSMYEWRITEEVTAVGTEDRCSENKV
jgi:hypothetical protein